MTSLDAIAAATAAHVRLQVSLDLTDDAVPLEEAALLTAMATVTHFARKAGGDLPVPGSVAYLRADGEEIHVPTSVVIDDPDALCRALVYAAAEAAVLQRALGEAVGRAAALYGLITRTAQDGSGHQR